MAHQIDTTTGKAAIAYTGETPWHGLGQKLQNGMSIDDWREAAGLDYEVLSSPVEYTVPGTGKLAAFPKRRVLTRSDTKDPLSIVSDDYKIVQPAEVLDFFGKLAEIGGFDLEVAGALMGGSRIWGLARVNDEANIIGQDAVRPYLLLATSYDGMMATTAKFTAIRVVCNNTLTMSVGGFMGAGKTEADTEGKAVSSLVKVPHSASFDADAVRQQLGIVKNVFERWVIETRILAEQAMSDAEADAFLKKLLPEPYAPKGQTPRPVETTRGYAKIMDLFQGKAIGAELTGGQTAWAMLNAVTEWVDHDRSSNDSNRMNAAWFGVGDQLKTRANTLLRQMVTA